MFRLLVTLFITLVSVGTAFNVRASRSNSGVSLKMALKDYKEELAKTAAAIAAPGKSLLTENRVV